MASAGSRRPRWRRAGVLGFAAVVLAAFAGEAGLRMRRVPEPSQRLIQAQIEASAATYVRDPELGALLAPSRSDTIRTPDFTFVLQTDHAGFPNPEPWPAGVDVAVLGNSLLEGAGVGAEGRFTSLLERDLPGRRVLNFALPGGGTEHELLVYRRFVRPLHPRLVVATVWITWDVENTREFVHWRREGRPDPDYTHYRFTYGQTHRGAKTPDRLPPGGVVWRFARASLNRSQLVVAAYRRLKRLLGADLIAERAAVADGSTVYLSLRDQERLARGLDRKDTPSMRDSLFGPLQQLRTEVEADGGHLVVVLMPSKEEIYGAARFPRVLRTIRQARAELEGRGLPVVDLYPSFEAVAKQRAPFWPADMHPNALGNRLMADALERWIREQQIFARSGSPPVG